MITKQPIDTELLKFLEDNAGTNNFANSLLNGEYGYLKRGFLTDKQLEAAERMKAEVEAKKEVAAEIAAEEDSDIDLTDLPSGRYAVPDGKTRLKVLIRRPGEHSNWHGWIFVSNAAVYGDGQRYGMQAPGKNYQGRIQTQLKAIIANPAAAMIEYGKLTGTCGRCGKTLEDEISVSMGIGPICADYMGIPRPSPSSAKQEPLIGLDDL